MDTAPTPCGRGRQNDRTDDHAEQPQTAAGNSATESSWYGDCLPERDFPMLIDLYQQGRLPLEKFVSEQHHARRGREGLPHDARRRRSALGSGSVSGLRIERVVTTGAFELDGGRWDVDNNVWLVGDDSEVVIIDAAHDEGPIVEAVGDRNVLAVVCTHGHNDHVTFAPQIGRHMDAPVLLHPGDQELWEMTHPGESFRHVADTERIAVAGTVLEVIHTPGHSPGSVCLHLPEAKSLFSGDTLFAGGPGATGRSFSDFPTIIDSIRGRLLTLPATSSGSGPAMAARVPSTGSRSSPS